MAIWSTSWTASLSSGSLTSALPIGTSAKSLDLVLVAELLHDQPLLVGAQQHQVVLAARRVAGEGGAAGLPHGLGEQPVGSVAPLVGPQVVGLLEIDRVDLLARHELGDLDGVRGLRG